MTFFDADRRLARFRVEESPAFLAMLKRHEGAHRRGGRHTAYRCPAGALTIGWGHNLDARPVRGLGPGSGLSEREADELLRADLAELAALMDLRLSWWRSLGAARSAVLLDMAYNLGLSGLLGFRRMLEAARRLRFAEAAREMLDSRWAGQVGRRARELAAMMRSGAWEQGEGSGVREARGDCEERGGCETRCETREFPGVPRETREFPAAPGVRESGSGDSAASQRPGETRAPQSPGRTELRP